MGLAISTDIALGIAAVAVIAAAGAVVVLVYTYCRRSRDDSPPRQRSYYGTAAEPLNPGGASIASILSVENTVNPNGSPFVPRVCATLSMLDSEGTQFTVDDVNPYGKHGALWNQKCSLRVSIVGPPSCALDVADWLVPPLVTSRADRSNARGDNEDTTAFAHLRHTCIDSMEARRCLFFIGQATLGGDMSTRGIVLDRFLRSAGENLCILVIEHGNDGFDATVAAPIFHLRQSSPRPPRVVVHVVPGGQSTPSLASFSFSLTDRPVAEVRENVPHLQPTNPVVNLPDGSIGKATALATISTAVGAVGEETHVFVRRDWIGGDVQHVAAIQLVIQKVKNLIPDGRNEAPLPHRMAEWLSEAAGYSRTVLSYDANRRRFALSAAVDPASVNRAPVAARKAVPWVLKAASLWLPDPENEDEVDAMDDFDYDASTTAYTLEFEMDGLDNPTAAEDVIAQLTWGRGLVYETRRDGLRCERLKVSVDGPAHQVLRAATDLEHCHAEPQSLVRARIDGDGRTVRLQFAPAQIDHDVLTQQLP